MNKICKNIFQERYPKVIFDQENFDGGYFERSTEQNQFIKNTFIVFLIEVWVSDKLQKLSNTVEEEFWFENPFLGMV